VPSTRSRLPLRNGYSCGNFMSADKLRQVSWPTAWDSPVVQFLKSSTSSTQKAGSNRMRKRATAASACFLSPRQDAANFLSWLTLRIKTMRATSIV